MVLGAIVAIIVVYVTILTLKHVERSFMMTMVNRDDCTQSTTERVLINLTFNSGLIWPFIRID